MEHLSKHSSQVDAAKGFGGKFGVQKDRVDKVKLGVKLSYIHSAKNNHIPIKP